MLKSLIFLVEKAPYNPAVIMHIKKKIRVFSFLDNKPKINPAAKKPLYNPWFAARILVSSANDFDFNPKTLIPLGLVHKNISRIKKHICSIAIKIINIDIILFIII